MTKRVEMSIQVDALSFTLRGVLGPLSFSFSSVVPWSAVSVSVQLLLSYNIKA